MKTSLRILSLVGTILASTSTALRAESPYLAPLAPPFPSQQFGTAVVGDGRIFVVGGSASFFANPTAQAAIYDPVPDHSASSRASSLRHEHVGAGDGRGIVGRRRPSILGCRRRRRASSRATTDRMGRTQ